MEEFPIIIVGAGASGLIAARELLRHGKKVIVLEARDRIGGRIHTVHENSYYVEAGAEFIHGELPLTIGLLREYHIGYRKIAGVMARIENGSVKKTDEFEGWGKLIETMKRLKKDMPLSDFLSKYFDEPKYDKLRAGVRRFAEGFDVADTKTVSTFALYEEWTQDDGEPQYRIEGGYEKLINVLSDDCKKMGCNINMSNIVKKIEWKKDLLKVFTQDEKEFTGSKIVVTVPMSILQSGAGNQAGIFFSPSIPALASVHGIGYGSVIKILLKFKEAIWEEKIKNAGFFFANEVVPTWWTQLPNQDCLLTGWLGGPKADELQQKKDDEILDITLRSLANIFQEDISTIQSYLIKANIFNWSKDPFALGAYSFPIIQTKESRKILNEPIDNTIFFSGEALYDGPSGGTVEAALTSGLETAKKIIRK